MLSGGVAGDGWPCAALQGCSCPGLPWRCHGRADACCGLDLGQAGLGLPAAVQMLLPPSETAPTRALLLLDGKLSGGVVRPFGGALSRSSEFPWLGQVGRSMVAPPLAAGSWMWWCGFDVPSLAQI